MKTEIKFIDESVPEVVSKLLEDLYKKGSWILNGAPPVATANWNITSWINFILRNGWFIISRSAHDWKFNRIDRYENGKIISYWLPCKRQCQMGTLISADFEIGEIQEV